MKNKLFRWDTVDSTELGIFLYQLIGGPGQSNLSSPKPREFYLPLGGQSCKVVLTLVGSKVTDLKPGPAFDAAQEQQISDSIERSITAPLKVGREYSFAGRPVRGSWRGAYSGVQILPAVPDAPVSQGDYPFILEFPLMPATLQAVSTYRRLRKHRDLTLLLNVLLVGGAKSLSFRQPHFWAMDLSDLGGHPRWLQQAFLNVPLGADPITDELSNPDQQALEEIPPEEYETLTGNDGAGLRVPADLDQSICSYSALPTTQREKFDRALFWFATASGMGDISISSSFLAFASAIESLAHRGRLFHRFDACPICGKQGTHEVRGPTKLFRTFLETYAPDPSLHKQRKLMYDLRSDIVHGSDLMEIDKSIPIMGWSPAEHEQQDLYREMWRVTRTALRNWLKSPPPGSVYVQRARENCAYFYWIERGRPLWEANVDWKWAEKEFPD